MGKHTRATDLQCMTVCLDQIHYQSINALQAFRVLFERLRLKPDDTDVRPYEVDGTNFLARTDHCTNNCISLVY